jgi:hypothetical protein
LAANYGFGGAGDSLDGWRRDMSPRDTPGRFVTAEAAGSMAAAPTLDRRSVTEGRALASCDSNWQFREPRELHPHPSRGTPDPVRTCGNPRAGTSCQTAANRRFDSGRPTSRSSAHSTRLPRATRGLRRPESPARESSGDAISLTSVSHRRTCAIDRPDE